MHRRELLRSSAIAGAGLMLGQPGEKHWHGASPTTAMTHVAVQEKLDGKAVDWLEHVTAEQYRG